MLPPSLIASLARVPGFDETLFLNIHAEAAPPVSIRINEGKWGKVKSDFLLNDPIPWCKTGFYLPERPVFTLDPLLHAGAYYVQEASSMFLEQALARVNSKNKEIKVALDLCAAPGGKSTHLLGLLPPHVVLVSNEVIQGRNSILQENITKWGKANTIVTQNDPSDFGKLGAIFDLIVVDAPCSGSGLFRRDNAAIKEWSPQAVALCSQRQQRILADALPCLKPGGYLLYATCSYSSEENEAIIDWLSTNFDMHGVNLYLPDEQAGIVSSVSPAAGISCYRFFPDKVRGEGFFMALMQKGGESDPFFLPQSNKKQATRVMMPPILSPWIIPKENPVFFQHKEFVFLMSETVYRLFNLLRSQLNIRKAGVKMAEEAHGKFNPAHDFLLSEYFNRDHFMEVPLDVSEAISFLRKDDFTLPLNVAKGWLYVSCNGLPLGWLKNLGNRNNNYYPKEWRIRMKG